MSDVFLFFKTNWANLLAITWFFVLFRGYAMYASRAAKTTHCLASVMHRYRLEWMEYLLERDVRIGDTNTIANLERSVAFFASTTMLILAGLITVMGSSAKAIDVISDIPFVSPATTAEWEMKLLLLVILFVYAFFKFTWSLRQYGFASVMIGGTPMPDAEMSPQARKAFAIRNANMMSLAANNFNTGLRTYYFCIAVLGWFVNPLVFMVMSLGITLVLYRREFKSRTLSEMMVSRSE